MRHRHNLKPNEHTVPLPQEERVGVRVNAVGSLTCETTLPGKPSGLHKEKAMNIKSSNDTRKGTGSRATISRRTFLRWAAGAGGMAALSTVLPCCGPSPSEPTSTPTSARPQELIIGSAVDIYTIDPAVGFDQAIGSSLKGLYDSLFRHVGNPPKAVPWLAESYDWWRTPFSTMALQ